MKREREREQKQRKSNELYTGRSSRSRRENTFSSSFFLSFFLSFFFESKNEETRDVSRIRIVNSVVDAYRIRQLQKANHQLTFAQREGRISRTRHNEGSCNEEHHPQGQVSCVFISCGMAWHSMERRRSPKKKKNFMLSSSSFPLSLLLPALSFRKKKTKRKHRKTDSVHD